MKLVDIKIGGRYTCKVSGKITTVRVKEFREVHQCHPLPNGKWVTQITAVNERTGKTINIRSPQRLRHEAVA